MKKILIADDDSAIVEVVGIALISEGYFSDHADTRDAILSKISTGEFGLILMDVWMGGDDGLALCREIKDMEQYVDLPIVIFTARSNIDSECKKAKADGCLYKPFEWEELLGVIRKYIKDAS